MSRDTVHGVSRDPLSLTYGVRMEIGTVADWVSACSALLAVAVASAAWIVARRSYQVQLEDVRRRLQQQEAEVRQQKEQARREQGDKVAAWLIFDEPEWNVHYVNASKLPVYELSIRVFSEDFDRVIHRGVEGPAGPRKSRRLTEALNKVLKQSGATATVARPDGLECELAFTDAAGVRWRRGPRGDLTEVARNFELRGQKVDQWVT